MGNVLIKNIKRLMQVRENISKPLQGKEMAEIPSIENAWLAVENGIITDYGSMDDLHGVADWRNLQVIDAENRFVLPAWCDSHTHAIHAGPRATEFVDRINGLSYEDIAARGGGILNSADKLRGADENQLYDEAWQRLDHFMLQGTGCIEIKSGYGLSVESELKMLRIAKRLRENHRMIVRSTFLGAHAVPREFQGNKSGYIDLLTRTMIPMIADQGLAEFIDVFCETNYFSADDTQRILEEGVKHGLVPKVHVNQFNSIGGIEICASAGALSVDHLEIMSNRDFEVLHASKVLPVALPGCSFFIQLPYTPGRRIIDEGLPLVLASDYNPGSCPSGNMNFVVSLACIHMKLKPEEAINAATINGAFAMRTEKEAGSIRKGSVANLIITKPMDSIALIPYHFGDSPIEEVIIRGERI